MYHVILTFSPRSQSDYTKSFYLNITLRTYCSELASLLFAAPAAVQWFHYHFVTLLFDSLNTSFKLSHKSLLLLLLWRVMLYPRGGRALSPAGPRETGAGDSFEAACETLDAVQQERAAGRGLAVRVATVRRIRSRRLITRLLVSESGQVAGSS